MLWLGLALIATASGCRVERQGTGTPPPPPRPDVLGGFWFIPGSRITDTTGTPDAQRKLLTVAMPLDTVRVIYRERLRTDNWTVVSDVGDSLRVAIHARRDSSLVWLNLERGGYMLTRYTVIGARAAPGEGSARARPPGHP